MYPHVPREGLWPVKIKILTTIMSSKFYFGKSKIETEKSEQVLVYEM